jgi:hypothetical protein
MERTAWTEERLDDLARSMREGFARVDTDLRDLRSDLGGRIERLQSTMNWVGGGIILTLIAAILTRGI